VTSHFFLQPKPGIARLEVILGNVEGWTILWSLPFDLAFEGNSWIEGKFPIQEPHEAYKVKK